ncbi:hypothetical protein BC940DRAFT_370294 [Gongronella butleri]|nr:hypothetical protein BC940DRAFT_370294 [Gongronella butleri]
MFWNNKHFELKDIPDLTGKMAIVTGANAGAIKARPVVDEIIHTTGNNNVSFLPLDLLSLASVKAFADAYKAKHSELHVLMNNAGIMAAPFGLSNDGIEQHFAVNHVAHFYLTMKLLPLLTTGPSRIVNVSAAASLVNWSWRLDRINDPSYYNRVGRYALSKVRTANILFTRELAKRLEQKGLDHVVHVNSCHPGIIRTNLIRHIVPSLDSMQASVIHAVLPMSENEGALTQLYLATASEIVDKHIQGQYVVPFGKPGCLSHIAKSDKCADELWNHTEALLIQKAPGYAGAPI